MVSQAALALLGSWIVRVWLLSGNSCPVCIEQLSSSIALFPGLSQEITLIVHGGHSLKGSTATLILLLSSCPQSHQPNKNSRNLHYGNRSQRWGGGSWQQLSQSCHLTPPESHCPPRRGSPATSTATDFELFYFAFYGALKTCLQTTLLGLSFRITSKQQETNILIL